MAIEDAGAFVAPIFEAYDRWVGKHIPIVADLRPIEEQLADVSTVLGRTIVYKPVPASVFAGFGFPGANDLAAMFEFYAHPTCDRSPDLARQLNPSATTLREWAIKHKAELEKAWFGQAA